MTAELSELKNLYAEAGPFASVYLDASRDTETGAHEVELRWRAEREHLAEQGVDDDTVAAMSQAIDSDRAPGKHGLLVVAAPRRRGV